MWKGAKIEHRKAEEPHASMVALSINAWDRHEDEDDRSAPYPEGAKQNTESFSSSILSRSGGSSSWPWLILHL